VNFLEKASSVSRPGDEKSPFAEVTVCGSSSRLVQVTVVPTETVSMLGTKAKPLIPTSEPSAALAVVGREAAVAARMGRADGPARTPVLIASPAKSAAPKAPRGEAGFLSGDRSPSSIVRNVFSVAAKRWIMVSSLPVPVEDCSPVLTSSPAARSISSQQETQGTISSDRRYEPRRLG